MPEKGIKNGFRPASVIFPKTVVVFPWFRLPQNRPLGMIPFWKKLPAVRLLFPLAAGILTQSEWPIPKALLFYLLLFHLAGLFGFQLLSYSTRFRLASLAGFFACGFFFATGAFLYVERDIRQDPGWIGPNFSKNSLLLRMEEPFELREKSWKTTATVIATIDSSGNIALAGGRILVYVRRTNSDSIRWKRAATGQWALLHQWPQLIPAPGNPGQFNYQRYCQLDNITHQVFANDQQLLLLPRQTGKLAIWLHRIRSNVVRIIQTYISNPQASGLAEALLIGYKKDLDRNLLQAYANTGVVHIIAISGLHLGLIFVLLRFITRFLPTKGPYRWIKPVCILSGLWIFCLLTGAQPSVTRSAVMFSFMVLSDSLHRRTQAINTLCFSAFLLLIWQPNWLWDIGFQLSYAAVASLIIFMQPVYRLLSFQKKWLDYIWQMNAVTLSAQIFTLPLCLYHFHQFPSYFLLANLVCVPLSSILLMACILLCVLSPFPPIATLVGQLINAGLLAMNEVVFFFQRLPAALNTNIPMDEWQAIFSFVAVASLSAFFLLGQRRARYPALFGFLALAVYGYCQKQQDADRLEWRLYQVAQQTVSDFVAGRKFVQWSVDSVDRNHSSYQFALANARHGWKEMQPNEFPGLQLGTNTFTLGSKRLYLLRQTVHSADIPTTDILCLADSAAIGRHFQLDSMRIRQIVASSSLSTYHSRQWRRAALKAGIPFHDVKTDGYFVLRCR